jgi:mycoredoxin
LAERLRASKIEGKQFSANIRGETMASIKMYTTTWCGDCRNAKRFLREHGVAFEEINIEEEAGAADYVMQVNDGKRKVPTFEVDGRAFNLSPYDERKLRAELGLN